MNVTLSVLAHVDAGKTTFSEQLLYRAHAIRQLGRVDDKNAFLDSHPLEKQRGITIFSGQARIETENGVITWLDTPGHADFSPEMERALSVTDYAILLVSATEGVQSHTETLWRLLSFYHVPTFIFLNKTDRDTADVQGTLDAIRCMFSKDAVDMRAWRDQLPNDVREEVALRDENILVRWPDENIADDEYVDALAMCIKERRLFPVFCGSALMGDGIDAFFAHMQALLRADDTAALPFSARIFRVRRDAQGTRMLFMKILSGTLHVKDEIDIAHGKIKVNELRLYHGDKYRAADSAQAGEVAAIPVAEGGAAGENIGEHCGAETFQSEPMAAADVLYDEKKTSVFDMLRALRQLEEEEPTLRVLKEREGISIHVMGKIQLEILKTLLHDRFGIEAAFGPCHVLYRETLLTPCVGVGHYEPLRHYAEVHLRLVPAPRGSGIQFVSLCHVDDLALNWQRLIETHVFEKEHKGVLLGAPLTDVKIELLSGRAHLKHTEGGDFREATYRAIRNALMYGKSVLLEPVCRFRLRVPAECFGKITGELMRLGAQTEAPVYDDAGFALLFGTAFYARMLDFFDSIPLITHGRGAYDCRMEHYAPCKNAAEVIQKKHYAPLAEDTPDSVFCAKGAGYNVPWQNVRALAHLPVEPDE